MHGLLLVDKPAGLTSHDVVARLRKLLRQKTVGHTGTLDPLATGLMVTVFGNATKLSEYLTAEDKGYRVDVRLGVTTDTLDRTGQVTARADVDHVGEAEVRIAAESLAGEFAWPVPMFSAAKVDGRKLYEYARRGEDLERPVKAMTFWNVTFASLTGDVASIDLECSKGSFVRSWALELGRTLGVGGSVEELRRWRVGAWDVSRAISLDQLTERLSERLGGDGSADVASLCGEAFIPIGHALPNLRSVTAAPRDVRLVGHGQIPRDIQNRLVFEQKQAFRSGESVLVKVVSGAGDLLAILAAEPGQGLKIRRVFPGFA